MAVMHLTDWDDRGGNGADGWVALAIGNSRLHWAWMQGREICRTWDSPHLPVDCDVSIPTVWLPWITPPGWNPEQPLLHPPDLWIASVVPQQTTLWQAYPNRRILTLDHVPLHHLYPTLGIDRAIALLGAVHSVGAPALVMDAGTALTFTGVDSQHQLVGGAILPGLRLQWRSLSSHTAALPLVDRPLPSSQLPRWARQTEDAILSGVVHALVAGVDSFMQAWQQQFPHSPMIVTGGDGAWLFEQLQRSNPGQGQSLQVDPHLIFRGMAALRR